VKTKIPIYNQSSEAVGGIFIKYFPLDDTDKYIDKYIDELGVHRDDCYIFFVLTKGKVSMKCDMVDVETTATSICMVKPFQIHSVGQVSKDAKGYFISVAPFLIPNNCASIFQDLTTVEQFQKMDSSQKNYITDTVALLNSTFKNIQSNKTQIINGLFNALVHHISNIYHSLKKTLPSSKSQSQVIASNFKKLIFQYSFLESPSFFAKKLNISTSHLNDCVKSSTSQSVTHWLQTAMIIEAQRLLYYTDNNVKEIAFSLGFEDHTYFSRLFKKILNETPLTFRKKFRE
jgi:AraC family transcriptional activator of pobA